MPRGNIIQRDNAELFRRLLIEAYRILAFASHDEARFIVEKWHKVSRAIFFAVIFIGGDGNHHAANRDASETAADYRGIK